MCPVLQALYTYAYISVTAMDDGYKSSKGRTGTDLLALG